MREEPRNAEAETWLLGGVFQYPNIMAQLAHALEPCDFYAEKNQLVWKAMQELQRDGRPIDVLTVGSLLKGYPAFQSIFGDNDYLFGLQESVASHANVDYYAELIAKASALRKLIAALQKTLGEAYHPAADADALLATAMERIADIASKSASAGDEQLADVALRFLDMVRDRMEKGVPMGFQTGFYDLDRLTGGLRPGELVIVGARTGVGKTSFALSLALNVAKKTPVKFFSLEVDENQFSAKALSFFSMVNMQRTLNAKIEANELYCQYEARKELQARDFPIEFKIAKIEKIVAESHAFCARHGGGLVIIDHLQFIDSSEKHENRNTELGRYTRALKKLAGDLKITVMVLSQLNREIERSAAKDKKPRLSDLRDSGNIEQDADMVWLLNRRGFYDDTPLSEMELIVAKNRTGPTGLVKLHFDAATTRISDAWNDGHPLDKSGYNLLSQGGNNG
jgi:replicative DNA helicase